jgi:hypothetical protein
MLQNIIALTIVFSATGYTVYSIVKNLTAKKTGNCGGCEGCSFKEQPNTTSDKILQVNHQVSQNFMFTRHKS